MSEYLGEIISAFPPQALLLVPALAFLESCVFVGLFISGIFLVSTTTLIYAQGETQLLLLTSMAFIGALAGDHLGFIAGQYGAPVLGRKRWVRKQLVRRKKGYRKARSMLTRSAPWAICLGRLYPPSRSITPLLAGASDITLRQFFIYDLLACTIWASGLTLVVYSASHITT